MVLRHADRKSMESFVTIMNNFRVASCINVRANTGAIYCFTNAGKSVRLPCTRAARYAGRAAAQEWCANSCHINAMSSFQ